MDIKGLEGWGLAYLKRMYPIKCLEDFKPMEVPLSYYMGMDNTVGRVVRLAGITTTHGGDYGKKEESHMAMKWQIGDRKRGNVIVGDDDGTIVACMYAKGFTRQEWKELNTKVLELFDVIEVDE